MIVIKDETCTDVDKTITFFEPVIRRLTNTFISGSPEKDDCRQALRIRVWDLFKNEKRVFNEAYIGRRLKFDLINFINRDAGYKWPKKFTSIEVFEEQDLDTLMADMAKSAPEDVIERINTEQIIDIASKELNDKQYECFILFLSGAPMDMIRQFLGSRSRNMSRYYLLLAESLAILKEVMDEETSY